MIQVPSCPLGVVSVFWNKGFAKRALPVNKVPRPSCKKQPQQSGTCDSSCVRSFRVWAMALSLILLVVVCVPAAVSQQLPATERDNSDVENTARSHPLTIPVPKPRTAASDPPEEASSFLQVTFQGDELFIQAKDRALSEILDAVRAKTGASIDVSGQGTSEHMTVKIGPGPARQVLSSLLGWTDFDYVIQGSEADSLGIQSIMLFPKTKPSGSTPGTPAMGPNRQPLASQPRGMPVPTPAPVETPEPEAAPAQEPIAEAAPATPERPASAIVPSAIVPAATPASMQGKSPDEMIQQMQQLFEQRRQIQIEHNNTPGAPPLPSH
jgi:hypothetical protein